jgi:hypothetical protein
MGPKVPDRLNRAQNHNPRVTYPGMRRPTGSAGLADMLRRQILDGALPPGHPLPADRYLQETYGLTRDTVRAALDALQQEGLVVRRQGQTSRVRRVYDKQPIDMTDVARVDIRMPSPVERDSLRERIEAGVPVWVVTYTDGRVVLLPGDRWTVRGPEWTAS